jgi:DtxR family Mn-dependent transcriptional regulator
MLSEAVEDYLKGVYAVHDKHGKVTTSLLAEKMDVSPASATSMIKKMAEANLVAHEPYQGVTLTETGLKLALEIIRHHRLVELYLSEALGVPWDRVHEEAEKWEHVLSEDVEDRMDKFLGYPTADPHGAPIPTRNGEIVCKKRIHLVDLTPGETAKVVEVSDHDPELLRYLSSLNIGLGTELTLVRIEPFDGPLTLTLEERDYVLGRNVALNIQVTNDKIQATGDTEDEEAVVSG